MSTQRPVTSNFHPWYEQRSPHSSLGPKNSPAPRWGQLAASIPTLPCVSRNATRSSPSRRTFGGGQLGRGEARHPVLAQQLAHRRSAPHATHQLIVFLREHGVPPSAAGDD